MSKTHLYCMPGMAAGSAIFQNLKLPDDTIEIHLLEWLVPESVDEPLEHYCKRMSQFVEHQDAVLLGVSFGGIVVQEMKKYVHPKQVIIISSVKSNQEFPRRLRFAQKTNAHKWVPYQVFSDLDRYEKYVFTDAIKKRVKLYKKYLSMNDVIYLPWAVHALVNWQRSEPDNEVIHIHGTDDFVFPAKYIQNYIKVEKGTHIMILLKAKKISELLQKIIRNRQS